MPIDFTSHLIRDSCQRYREGEKERRPLELDVENRWTEEQEMLRRFPVRFQEDSCIDARDDFKLLTRWKWPGLWSNYAKKNSQNRVRRVTQTAFDWGTEMPEGETETILRDQIGVLTCLDGVDAAMASVILTFWQPDEHTVMDERALLALKQSADDEYRWTEREEASRKHYPAYVEICKRLRDDLEGSFSLREIDQALWILGDQD
ncbi:hypothetical protein [Halorubrum sp. BV1]|uniref:hypothetical protein n=1 Tax=Halorubrum sp. BV1 TaxID=1498500 RepID=UPI00067861B7|nr:hypothetical protein [Halorubrum sp. BV1]